MERKDQHYYTQFPDAKLKIYTVSPSLRKHLYVFKTVTGIYSYKKIDLGTKILIEQMTIPNDPSVILDLGCGYGPIGIVLGYESPDSKVYLIDINKRATWCANENVKLNIPNYKKRVFVFSGNYFEPLKNKDLKFDGIYTNPPLRQGRKDFLHVCNEITHYLKPKGFFQFVIKKKMGAPFILRHLRTSLPTNEITVICKRSGFWVFNYFQD